MIKHMLQSKFGKGLMVAVAVIGLGATVVMANPAQANAACYGNVYGYGSRGSCVRNIQIMLNSLGSIGERITPDGIFGNQTKAKVKRFQTRERLTSDGIVGPKTWGRLCVPKYTSVVNYYDHYIYGYNSGCPNYR